MEQRILITGPQGSGKGTQAEILSKKLQMPALSLGQLFRDEIASGSEFGCKLEAILGRGDLVGDEDALNVLKNRLAQPDARNGYILDGYPRNIEQLRAFDTIEAPQVLLVLDVPREESVKRLLKRAEIEGRPDDTAELIEHRLKIYEEKTQPVIEEYERRGIVKYVNGLGTVEEVADRIEEALNI